MPKTQPRRAAPAQPEDLGPPGGHPADAEPGYIPYPRAMALLRERLNASPQELALWVFMGPDLHGLQAYCRAHEQNAPPRFNWTDPAGDGDDARDLIGPLMHTWYRLDEVQSFTPQHRYISGQALLDRWGGHPDIDAQAFIVAKVREDRLQDYHPRTGLTQASVDDASMPPLGEGLFSLCEVEAIEREDFGGPLAPLAARPESSTGPWAAPADTPADDKQPKPRPHWAPNWHAMDVAQKSQVLHQRMVDLKRNRIKNWRAQIADDLGITPRRVSQLLERAKKPNPFSRLGSRLHLQPPSSSK